MQLADEEKEMKSICNWAFSIMEVAYLLRPGDMMYHYAFSFLTHVGRYQCRVPVEFA